MSHSKQIKLDGGYALENTYFNHPANTAFEKCVEACYFFNKTSMNKQQCLFKAQEIWKTLKHDNIAFQAYLKKHETAQKKRSLKPRNSFFQPIVKKDTGKNVTISEIEDETPTCSSSVLSAVPHVADITEMTRSQF